MKLRKPILKQMIMIPHTPSSIPPPAPQPHYPVLNPLIKQLYDQKAQHETRFKLKKKLNMREILHLSWSAIIGMDR